MEQGIIQVSFRDYHFHQNLMIGGLRYCLWQLWSGRLLGGRDPDVEHAIRKGTTCLRLNRTGTWQR